MGRSYSKEERLQVCAQRGILVDPQDSMKQLQPERNGYMAFDEIEMHKAFYKVQGIVDQIEHGQIKEAMKTMLLMIKGLQEQISDMQDEEE